MKKFEIEKSVYQVFPVYQPFAREVRFAIFHFMLPWCVILQPEKDIMMKYQRRHFLVLLIQIFLGFEVNKHNCNAFANYFYLMLGYVCFGREYLDEVGSCRGRLFEAM
jgi:hypothetical protein